MNSHRIKRSEGRVHGPHACCRSGLRCRGFSYIEVMIAVLLIVVVLVPASDLLASAVRGGQVHQDVSTSHYHLLSKMEEVLARPFAELRQQADDAGSPTAVVTAYSDSAGTPQRRLVYLSRYDADDADGDNSVFTGTQEDLLWVKVEIERSSFHVSTLVDAGS